MSIVDELRSLDTSDPGRWPLPFRVVAVGLAFVAVLAFGIYMFVVKEEMPFLERSQQELQAHPGAIAASARTGDGVEELLRVTGERLRALTQVVELRIPYDRGDVVASVHRAGEVLVESADEGGMRLRARLDDASATRLHQFVVD
jgi:50S ribosomal subunit-associated GTPase HflX